MAATTRAVAALSELKPLPHCRALTGRLRWANAACDGPGTFYLAPVLGCWELVTDTIDLPHVPEGEPLPGDGKPFNAIGAARRLLSNARQAGFR